MLFQSKCFCHTNKRLFVLYAGGGMLLPDSPDFWAYALRAYIKEALRRRRYSLYLLSPNSITPAKTNV
jgi:hypothetical protein